MNEVIVPEGYHRVLCECGKHPADYVVYEGKHEQLHCSKCLLEAATSCVPISVRGIDPWEEVQRTRFPHLFVNRINSQEESP